MVSSAGESLGPMMPKSQVLSNYREVNLNEKKNPLCCHRLLETFATHTQRGSWGRFLSKPYPAYWFSNLRLAGCEAERESPEQVPLGRAWGRMRKPELASGSRQPVAGQKKRGLPVPVGFADCSAQKVRVSTSVCRGGDLHHRQEIWKWRPRKKC